MVKSVLKKATYSLFCLFVASCSFPPAYNRDEINHIIKKTCKDEFNINVTVWNVGDTLWVYSSEAAKGQIPPLELSPAWKHKKAEKEKEKTLSYRIEQLDIEKQATKISYKIKAHAETKNIDVPATEIKPSEEKTDAFYRGLFNVIYRSVLNLEEPFKFYVVVLSDPNTYYDAYYISFFPDTYKFNTYRISIEERKERTLYFDYFNPLSKGSASGDYIKPYDLSPNEFVSTLLLKEIIEDINAEISNTGVDNKSANSTRKILKDVLSIASESAERIIPIYLDIHSISTVTLEDLGSGKTKTLSFVPRGAAKNISVAEPSIASMFLTQFYYKLANTYLQNKEYEAAIAAVDKILAINPDYPFAQLIKAEAYDGLNKWTEAIGIFETIINKYPRLLPALEGAASSYYKVGDYAKALEIFKIIIARYPEWWPAYYRQGNVYQVLGDYEMALKSYHSSLEALEKAVIEAKKYILEDMNNEAIDKDRAMIKNAIAFVYIATGAHPLAETYLSQSLALDQENTSALFNSGLSYHMQGKLDKAIEQYKKVLTVDKESLLANWYLAKAYAQAGQYVEAIKFYEEALLLKPDNAQRRDIYLDMGIAYLNEKKDPAKALFNIRNALALDPENIKIKYHLASAYLFLKEDEQAEYYLKQIIEKDNTFAYAYQDLGLICFKRKDFAKAKANFIKAKELFEAQGNKEAAEVLQPYLAFDPEKFPFPETTK